MSGENLFSTGEYGEDDEDADKIYAAVDERMEGRHKRRREKREEEELAKKSSNGTSGKISDQFSDLKQKLSGVTEEEWLAIPEVGEHGGKHKKANNNEMFTPLVDSMVEKLAAQLGEGVNGKGRVDNSISAGNESNLSGGVSSLSAAMGLSGAREKVVSMTLDKMSDSVGGQSVVDPKGYLTSLSQQNISTSAEIGDIKKARLLLKSVCDTNPKHGPGWIAAARLEEFAGKLVAARKIVKDGTEACPNDEDVWLEAVRLQPKDASDPQYPQERQALPVRKRPRRKSEGQENCSKESAGKHSDQREAVEGEHRIGGESERRQDHVGEGC
jgi:pre-mRNA-processing factor 6